MYNLLTDIQVADCSSAHQLIGFRRNLSQLFVSITHPTGIYKQIVFVLKFIILDRSVWPSVYPCSLSKPDYAYKPELGFSSFRLLVNFNRTGFRSPPAPSSEEVNAFFLIRILSSLRYITSEFRLM